MPVSGDDWPDVDALLDEPQYLGPALEALAMTRERLHELARTRGRVLMLDRHGSRAGAAWIEQRESVLHIHGFFLKAEFRGKGLGKQALHDLIQTFKDDCDRVELGVHVSNKPALHIYESLGFRTTKEMPEIGFRVMQLPLKNADA